MRAQKRSRVDRGIGKVDVNNLSWGVRVQMGSGMSDDESLPRR